MESACYRRCGICHSCIKKWKFEHIDHIIPLATAKTEKEVLDLCKINNLQLLTPEDNMSKKDKLDWSLNFQKKFAKKDEI